MKKTGAVLVAAGLSSRMQEFKPMLPYEDSTIAIHMVEMLLRLQLDPVVVVTGFRAEELEKHLFHTGVRFVKNVRYETTQMFDSVVLGIENIQDECERVMIMPIDIPAIQLETIRQALMVDADIVRTMCQGKPGHPIILQSTVAKKICAYQGEGGLKGAIENSGYTITNLEVDDEGVYWDVDTLEEYQELIEWNYGQGKGYPIKPKIQVTLAANEVFFGPGTCRLLELIEQTGSIQDACIQMNLSYSKGNKMLKKLDRQLGFSVVERRAGGSGGGGSVLTDAGKRLVDNYKKMVDELQEQTDETFKKYFEKGIR